jgi:hypothetical protein
MTDQSDLNTTENQRVDENLTSASITRAAALQDAGTASLQSDLSGDTRLAGETIPPAEVADLSAQLGERGVDLGGLLTAMMAASGQTKPKPGTAKEIAGKDEDPAVLLGKLAKSLGISPAELIKRLEPMLKEILATGSVKRRHKPKTETAKPAAKPKPKKATNKPKKETGKPAAKPKPKKVSKAEPIAQ